MFRKCLPLFLVMALIPSLFACGAPVEEEEQEAVIEEEEEVEEEVVEEAVEEELVEEEEEEEVVEQPPEADFEADVVEGQAPASVTFTNNSAYVDECLWDFGDGTSMTTATLDEPVTHEYTEAGTHTVTLTAIKKGDPVVTDMATLTISIDHGPLARVRLNTEAVRLGLGQTLTFTAEATDAYDNPITEARFTWEVAEGAGMVDASGVFTAAMQAGEYPQGIVATATLDGNTVTAAVAVTVALFPDINLNAVINEAFDKGPSWEVTAGDLFTLRELVANERDIADLTGIENCVDLMWLELARNQINDVSPLHDLTTLTSLDLSGNQINDVSPLHNLRTLRSLDLSDNQISDISPLARLYNMGGLHLSGNQISDVSPLHNLRTLRSLDLSDNQISDVSPLTALLVGSLYLSGNQISDILPLTYLTALGSLDLSDNPLSDTSVNIYIPKIEERGAEVTW